MPSEYKRIENLVVEISPKGELTAFCEVDDTNKAIAKLMNEKGFVPDKKDNPAEALNKFIRSLEPQNSQYGKLGNWTWLLKSGLDPIRPFFDKVAGYGNSFIAIKGDQVYFIFPSFSTDPLTAAILSREKLNADKDHTPEERFIRLFGDNGVFFGVSYPGQIRYKGMVIAHKGEISTYTFDEYDSLWMSDSLKSLAIQLGMNLNTLFEKYSKEEKYETLYEIASLIIDKIYSIDKKGYIINDKDFNEFPFFTRVAKYNDSIIAIAGKDVFYIYPAYSIERKNVFNAAILSREKLNADKDHTPEERFIRLFGENGVFFGVSYPGQIRYYGMVIAHKGEIYTYTFHEYYWYGDGRLSDSLKSLAIQLGMNLNNQFKEYSKQKDDTKQKEKLVEIATLIIDKINSQKK